MGLFDSILGAATGGNADAGGLTSIVTSLITQHGGLGGLVDKFHAGGLGDAVQSWVGTGQNLPISADQVQSVLGNEQVAAIAGKLGIDPQQAAQHLSQYLPQIINHLTPDGQVPAGDNADLLGSLGKLFGR
ncbi:MAG: DUF937 domain-containing protein [Proteobacteria bacterium]|nr:DUF937 domain-containing protein [Pseudomonadota bacterium]